MRYILLLLIVVACREVREKKLLSTQTIMVNGNKFSRSASSLIRPDSSYWRAPNACYYLSCDTCKYVLSGGVWEILDGDSLYFSSVEMVPDAALTVNQQRIDAATSLTALEELFKGYVYKVEKREANQEDIFTLTTADHCQLNFRFQKGALKFVEYGIRLYR